jgi:hypothetical protein
MPCIYPGRDQCSGCEARAPGARRRRDGYWYVWKCIPQGDRVVTLEGKMMINQNRPDFWIPDHSHHAHMKLIFLHSTANVFRWAFAGVHVWRSSCPSLAAQCVTSSEMSWQERTEQTHLQFWNEHIGKLDLLLYYYCVSILLVVLL